MYNPNIHHRRSIRLKNYDYSGEGLYFITICAHRHAVGAYCIRPDDVCTNEHYPNNCIFGDIVDDEMQLNKYGEIVYNEWLRTAELRQNIDLGEFVVMPNHFHAILRIAETRRGVLHTPLSHTPLSHTPQSQTAPTLHTPHTPNSPILKTIPTLQNLPELPNLPMLENLENVDAFDNVGGVCERGVCERGVCERGVCNTPLRVVEETTRNLQTTTLRSPSQTIGAIVRGFKSAVTKKFNELGFVGAVWQRNYYEHIIRTPKSHDEIANYILSNPQNWLKDKLYYH